MVYGAIEGSRKGHNTKHRGKQGLRPVLCFLAETREYLCESRRGGETITLREVARPIRQFRAFLPAYVRAVRVHGDGEFIGWESVQACRAESFEFTFGNKRCAPAFPAAGWYRHGASEYNECLYQPQGWCRVGSWSCASQGPGGGPAAPVAGGGEVPVPGLRHERARPSPHRDRGLRPARQRVVRGPMCAGPPWILSPAAPS